MNLVDHNVTGLADVTEAIRNESAKYGLNSIAGELVGLVPLQAMLTAGGYYHNESLSMEHMKRSDEVMLVKAAITGLMLDELEGFDPDISIIEWTLESHLGDQVE